MFIRPPASPHSQGSSNRGFARGEYAWLRELVEISPPSSWFNVRDSLREHLGDGRQVARSICIKRSRDLQTQMVGTPMAEPTLDSGVENFIEPIPESAKRVICWKAATLHGAPYGTSSRLYRLRGMQTSRIGRTDTQNEVVLGVRGSPVCAF